MSERQVDVPVGMLMTGVLDEIMTTGGPAVIVTIAGRAGMLMIGVRVGRATTAVPVETLMIAGHDGMVMIGDRVHRILVLETVEDLDQSHEPRLSAAGPQYAPVVVEQRVRRTERSEPQLRPNALPNNGSMRVHRVRETRPPMSVV